jgi:hypothetical protein
MTGARRPQRTTLSRGSRPNSIARRPRADAASSRSADRNAPRSGHDRHDTSLEHTSTSPLRWSARPHAPRGRWATGAGRSPGSRLVRVASAFPPIARQWLLGRRLPLTVAGAAAALRSKTLAPRSLFTRQAPQGDRTGTVTRGQRSKGDARLSTGCFHAPTDCACLMASTPRRFGAVDPSGAGSAGSMVDRQRESLHRPAHACRR